MNISLGIKNLLPLIALGLGILALVVPRHIHFIVAGFLISFAVVGLGLLR
jgi:hypothetical protein